VVVKSRTLNLKNLQQRDIQTFIANGNVLPNEIFSDKMLKAYQLFFIRMMVRLDSLLFRKIWLGASMEIRKQISAYTIIIKRYHTMWKLRPMRIRKQIVAIILCEFYVFCCCHEATSLNQDSLFSWCVPQNHLQ
jgi:hypothetical protein